MKKGIIACIACMLTFSASAQINKISLQAAGLTCSMCSNSIFKALKTLDFVESVDANIKNSSFDISFKTGGKVDFDAIKTKVDKAGYSVAKFYAYINVDNISVTNDEHVALQGLTFHFMGIKNQILNGIVKLQVLDKGFVTAKEYKKNSTLTKMECYKSGSEYGNRIFHATL